jgi:hypothetical protein
MSRPGDEEDYEAPGTSPAQQPLENDRRTLVGVVFARPAKIPLPRVATLRGQSMPRDVAYFCSIMLAVAATRVNADIRRRVVLNGA